MRLICFYAILMLQGNLLAQSGLLDFEVDSIIHEARRLDNSRKYKEWKAKEDTIYKYYIIGSGRGMHVYPRSPSFESNHWYNDPSRSLNASLPYYYLRIKENEDNQTLLFAYFEAITLSKDTTNRLDLILYFSQEENRPQAFKDYGPGWWNNYISAAASRKWVNDYLEENLNDRTTENDLSWVLVKAHARHLNLQNSLAAYEHQKSTFFEVPSNGETEYWDLFFNLNPDQALVDLLSFWNDSTSSDNFYITVVLFDNLPCALSDTVAKYGCDFFREVIQNTSDFGGLGNDYFIPSLNTIMFMLDYTRGSSRLRSEIGQMMLGKGFDYDKDYKRFTSTVYPTFLRELPYTEYEWLMSLIMNNNVPDDLTLPALRMLYSEVPGMFQKVMLEMKTESEISGEQSRAYTHGLHILNEDIRNKNSMLQKIDSGSR